VAEDSVQGDARFTDVLRKMGCSISVDKEGLVVTGGPLRAVRVDMSDMPDMVPTLAVVAAHAEGTTVIENVAHLKAKESDRIASVANELEKMGIRVKRAEDGLHITGGMRKGAEIETYDDHRIAMSFAIAGLTTPGVVIKNEQCVGKSFPNFWQVFETLYKIA
jgi:3-phosphoshikimate 1-carboxyvinyltransferase